MATKIRVSCGRCGLVFTTLDDYAGRSTHCPGCKAPLTVPTGSPDVLDDPRGVTTTLYLGTPTATLLPEIDVEPVPPAGRSHLALAGMGLLATLAVAVALILALGDRETVPDKPPLPPPSPAQLQKREEERYAAHLKTLLALGFWGKRQPTEAAVRKAVADFRAAGPGTNLLITTCRVPHAEAGLLVVESARVDVVAEDMLDWRIGERQRQKAHHKAPVEIDYHFVNRQDWLEGETEADLLEKLLAGIRRGSVWP